MNKTKSFDIPKQLVFEAYLKVLQNKGTAGIDEVSIQKFKENFKDNLYKLWNRMSSGSYFPAPVKTVSIPKKGGGERLLGIPTVTDRIAQTAVTLYLEPLIEPSFDVDSYGYRPNKSALQAIGQARQRCWKSHWVIDLDIKGFFDNLDHELVMKAVKKHTSCQWVLFYVERWLKASVQQVDGKLIYRTKGTAQGGVISPLLANLFLHYAIDKWMRKFHPDLSFERYADDLIVHCKSKVEAEQVLKSIEQRLNECNLAVNLQKTKIAYCGMSKLYDEYPIKSFDFLGYTFRRRLTRTRTGKQLVGFIPAISNKAKCSIRQVIKRWRIHRRTNQRIEELAKWINPYLRGWVNYYGHFYRSEMQSSLLQIEYYLKRWVRNKFSSKTNKTNIHFATRYLGSVRKHKPMLFEHWRYGWGSPIV